MPQFNITARRQTFLDNGMVINKGDNFTLNIPMGGITPNNLFGNPRCRDIILRQFSSQGIELPPYSPLLNSARWDIKAR